MPKYTALLIDADDTLLDFKKSESLAFKKLCGFLNIPHTEKLHQTYHKVNLAFWKLFEKGLAEKAYFLPQRFYDAFLMEGFHVDGDKANDFYFRALAEESHLLPGALEFVREASRYADLYLCSNGNAYVQEKRLSASPITPYFKHIFISEKVGAQKPSAAFFDVIFDTIPQNRSESLMIGDSKSSDIQGGINAKIDTCFIDIADEEDRHPEIIPTYSVHSYGDIINILRTKQ